jgi:hypothetical protein
MMLALGTQKCNGIHSVKFVATGNQSIDVTPA